MMKFFSFSLSLLLLAIIFCVLAFVPAPTGIAEAQNSQPVLIHDKLGKTVGSYKGSYALVIGISDYTGGWPTLPGVKQDVRLIAQALEKNGFKVETVENPDEATLEKTYTDFILKYGLDPDNRLVFYFAGHGYTHKPSYATEDRKEWLGYIVSRDAPLPSADFAAFRRNALGMDRFASIAQDIEAKHALFLFDSCFSGTIFALSRAVPLDISEQSARPVRQFISSGSADQEVPDTSEFRRQFISGLEGEADKNHDGYVTGSELGQFLQDRVEAYSRGAQTPQYGKIRNPRLDKGDFVFPVQLAAREPAPAPSFPTAAEPAPAPPPLALRGHLQVNVNVPVAQVSVNGRYAGVARLNAPLNIRDLDAGVVQVRVEAEQYEPVERAVNIGVNLWTQEPFVLQPTHAVASSSAPAVALNAPLTRMLPAPPPISAPAPQPTATAPAPPAPASPVAPAAQPATVAPVQEAAIQPDPLAEQRRIEAERVKTQEQRREKEELLRRAEVARQAAKWREAEGLYELALDLDLHDPAGLAALAEVKAERWKMLATDKAGAPQVMRATPSRSRLSLTTHQSRFFGVQAMTPGLVDPPLLYSWKIDGAPVRGQEAIEFKDQAVGEHTVSVVIETPSGETVKKEWIVDIQDKREDENKLPIGPVRVQPFDIENSVVSTGQKKLTVSGKVRNIDEAYTENIVVWVTALDDNEQPVLRRISLAEPQTLAPEQIGAFEVAMENLPAISHFRVTVVSK